MPDIQVIPHYTKLSKVIIKRFVYKWGVIWLNGERNDKKMPTKHFLVRGFQVIICCILVFAIGACSKMDSEPANDTPEDIPYEDNNVISEVGDDLDIRVEYEKRFIDIPSLKERYENYFSIGAAIDYNVIDRYKDIILKHFSSVTPGNSIKPDTTQPAENTFKFDKGDKVVNFGIENGIDVRGHTLVWHNQTPSWFFKDAKGELVSRDVALERMRNHINNVMSHYKGKIKEWDVVNEPISDDDSSILRTDSPWYQVIGEDYVKMAFIYAHEADPDAKLFINDYNIVVPGKRERFYNFVKALLDEGVPIHGIGIQGHWQLDWPSYEDIRYALDLFSSLGVDIQITELDISFYSWGDSTAYKEPPAELLEKQARRYQLLFDIFKDYSNVISKVTLWGVADDDTWLDNFPVPNRKNWPLLFDINHQPKESFWRIVEEPVLSGIEVNGGTMSEPFDFRNLTYVIHVGADVENITIKPIANDPEVDVEVLNGEKNGDYYLVEVDNQLPQAEIVVSGYGKTNTYELYIEKDKR